ncbi:MAG: 4Fe-4S ferredoxin [Clostridia bacterium]|nr:4Fe-4S ferredoxin [Clostridia bacterium]
MVEMIKVILGNLFSKPATRGYPLVKREAFNRARGQLRADLNNCSYCTLCQKKCPSACINVNKATKSWELDAFACVICGICAEVCPRMCLSMDGEYRQPVYTK